MRKRAECVVLPSKKKVVENNQEMEGVGEQPPRPPQERESEAEKKLRYWSIRIAHLTMFTFTVGFSIVLTGVYPYLKEVLITCCHLEHVAHIVL